MTEVATRKEAINKGLSTYFTNKPCIYGHISKRLVSTRGCSECASQYRKIHKEETKNYDVQYRIKKREKIKAFKTAYYAQNKDKIKVKNAEYQIKNREKIKLSKSQYRIKNKEKLKVLNTQWRARNKENQKIKTKKYYADNKERIRLVKNEYYYRNREKINEQICKKIVKKQMQLARRPKPNACEVCGEINLKICWDHCHISGLFRGWICYFCNVALGFMKDNPSTALKLAEYLTNFQNRLNNQINHQEENKFTSNVVSVS